MRVDSYVQLFYGIRLMLRKQGDCPLGKEAQLIKGREAIVWVGKKASTYARASLDVAYKQNHLLLDYGYIFYLKSR